MPPYARSARNRACPWNLARYLGDIEYPLSEEGSKQRHTKDRSADTKHIQFWMATPISAIDNLRRTHAFGPVHRADIGEIDEVLWLTPAEARKKLSHSTDKDILALFVDRVQEGALDAVPVIIVRHGKAEARKPWKGSDANRPITPRGAAAAYALNRELACFNPTRLATSPWVRCQETLEMFAWQTGRDMVHLDPLTEDAYAAAPDTAWELVESSSEIEFALERRQPIAICMHRPVIGGVFGHLRSMCVAPSLSKRLIAKTRVHADRHGGGAVRHSDAFMVPKSSIFRRFNRLSGLDPHFLIHPTPRPLPLQLMPRTMVPPGSPGPGFGSLRAAGAAVGPARMGSSRPSRPAQLDPAVADGLAGGMDPQALSEMSHLSAAALLVSCAP